jgi:predicted nuclease with TOPRIM domain
MNANAEVVREALTHPQIESEWPIEIDRDVVLAALDALVAERDEAVEMSRQMVAAYELAGEETEAAEAERDRLIAERQRLTDENDKGVRALWDEKNKFMEALEVEMVEKKALIAERERLRDEIDADCVRIVAAEAEVARLREALRLIASGGCAIPSMKCIPGMSCSACIARDALAAPTKEDA